MLLEHLQDDSTWVYPLMRWSDEWGKVRSVKFSPIFQTMFGQACSQLSGLSAVGMGMGSEDKSDRDSQSQSQGSITGTLGNQQEGGDGTPASVSATDAVKILLSAMEGLISPEWAVLASLIEKLMRNTMADKTLKLDQAAMNSYVSTYSQGIWADQARQTDRQTEKSDRRLTDLSVCQTDSTEREGERKREREREEENMDTVSETEAG